MWCSACDITLKSPYYKRGSMFKLRISGGKFGILLYRIYSTCTIFPIYFAYNSIKLLYYIIAIIAQVSDVANGFLFIKNKD